MFTPDEVAGIVDIFGALTFEEVEKALSELAYRRGETLAEGAIEDALEAFALVEFDQDGERLLVPGPAAFPELPEGSEDLPHIMDVDDRPVDRAAIEVAAAERLRRRVDRVVAAGDRSSARDLIEVSYDLEAWGVDDLSGSRERLEGLVDDTN